VNIDKQVNPFTGQTIGDGSATVVTSGSRIRLSSTSTPITAVMVIAKSGNTGTIWLGGSTVAVNRGRPLLALQAETIQINDLNKVYIDADTNGSGVTFLYVL
jgi:hypothetical protein